MNRKLPPGLPRAPKGAAVRLPEFPAGLVPAGPSAPIAPPPPPAPVMGISSSYEAQTVNVGWPRDKIQSVYTTHRRWRACDVFVQLPADLGAVVDFTLSVLVYAIAQRSRSLVASGRLEQNAVSTSTVTQRQQWVAAARASAERYEVALQLVQTNAAAALPGGLTVTVVATDEMTDPPAGIGAFPRFSNGDDGVKFQSNTIHVPERLEVVSVHGVSAVAAPAPRYLQLYDADVRTFAALAGSVPIMVWPLGSDAGQGLPTTLVNYRAQIAPVLAISTDPKAFVSAGGDCECGITVR